MHVHEYQGKKLLQNYGVPILEGGVATSPTEAVNVARRIGGSVWVVKAQVHAGGRGKGGGIKLARSLDDVQNYAEEIIGMTLHTPQTGSAGKKVRVVYIEGGCEIQKELYLSLLIDRSSSKVAIVASSEGGMDIEEVAQKSPEKITTVMIDPLTGLCGFHIYKLASTLALKDRDLLKKFSQLVKKLYAAFVDMDASLMEINPLVITKEQNILPLDAKIGFDDNALYRHENIQELRDYGEEDPAEVKASSFDLNYIKLEGSIGCMVNGAGLAMATMDIIKLYGGEPANFLDVGGGADKEKVTEAFKIILSDPNV